jgi:hypothetical protein
MRFAHVALEFPIIKFQAKILIGKYTIQVSSWPEERSYSLLDKV